MKPEPSAYGEFYRNYIELVPNSDLIDGLKSSAAASLQFWNSIPEEKGNYRYAEGKWSIKEVFQHLIDTERIFCHRALSFAREDGHALPGFDENAYVPSAEVGRRTLAGIGEELVAVRSSTILLFRSFSPAMLLRMGTANDKRMSVRALGWTIAGHAIHHLDVIEQRYN